MMDNIERVIGIVFRRVPVPRVIEGEIRVDRFDENEFTLLMRNYLPNLSDTEIRNMYFYLKDTFAERYFSVEETDDMSHGLKVFSLLKYYCRWLLTFSNNEVACEYSRMFHWRKLTTELSEDLLVAAFLAANDCRQGVTRNKFDWKLFITHNNTELHKIVSRGVCENHYHLKGSGPIFQLTWINLMNRVFSPNFVKHIAEIESDRRISNLHYSHQYTEEDISVQITQAALIRLCLCSVLLNVEIELYDNTANAGEYVNMEDKSITIIRQMDSRLRDPQELFYRRKQILREIENFGNRQTHKGEMPDYAMLGIHDVDLEMRRGYIWQGERWFMYSMLQGIYNNDPKIAPLQDYFYAYLLIKETLRGEMIQINENVGFENFRIYQDRKEFFLEDDNILEGALVREAICSSMIDSRVVTLEMRIAPKDDWKSFRKTIQKYDKEINYLEKNNQYEGIMERIFYAIHFIKTGSDRCENTDVIKCRHFDLRRKCRKQACALTEFREKCPELGKRIRGIDAANVEIGCGPEVFAQAFRYLSCQRYDKMTNSDLSLPQLKITYHAGEDFLDVISGIRAIDEAIYYLDMNCGERIGHALALGINVEEWYKMKNYRILIPQQEHLDNIVWMYQMIVNYQLPVKEAFRDFLRSRFQYYFDIIYQDALDTEYMAYIIDRAHDFYNGDRLQKHYTGNYLNFDIDAYFWSWSLRGDAPELYEEGFFNNRLVENSEEHYFAYAVNKRYPIKQEMRYFKEAGLLYYLYHFNKRVRLEGEKCIEVKLKAEWVEAVAMLQKCIQRHIERLGIGIETNPTSNYMVGTFKRYDKHPIISWYNNKLETDPEILADCPQMNVSINTDDQGVFNTSLENEYAYMALALEKKKGSDGKKKYNRAQIYQWIDDIRKMGINQTFLEPEEIEMAFENRKLLKNTICRIE